MIEIVQGEGPIVLGLPHTGTEVPKDIWARLNETGRALADTDWHIHRLYDGLRDDVSTVRTRIHRYAIDVNRGPDNASLYPGQNTTGLCPLTDFDGAPIYSEGQEPDNADVEQRREAYHAPYHAALSTELARVKAIHGVAVLLDCHSIRSVIPYLFAGKLPDFNIGTNLSTTCAPVVEQTVERLCRQVSDYTTVLNGRFKGGWTTRHYGRPDKGYHAIQMELAQSTYMREAPPWSYQEAKADQIRSILAKILNALQAAVQTGDLK